MNREGWNYIGALTRGNLAAYRLRLNLWLRLYIELPPEIIFVTRESVISRAPIRGNLYRGVSRGRIIALRFIELKSCN